MQYTKKKFRHQLVSDVKNNNAKKILVKIYPY